MCLPEYSNPLQEETQCSLFSWQGSGNKNHIIRNIPEAKLQYLPPHVNLMCIIICA